MTASRFFSSNSTIEAAAAAAAAAPFPAVAPVLGLTVGFLLGEGGIPTKPGGCLLPPPLSPLLPGGGGARVAYVAASGDEIIRLEEFIAGPSCTSTIPLRDVSSSRLTTDRCIVTCVLL